MRREAVSLLDVGLVHIGKSRQIMKSKTGIVFYCGPTTAVKSRSKARPLKITVEPLFGLKTEDKTVRVKRIRRKPEEKIVLKNFAVSVGKTHYFDYICIVAVYRSSLRATMKAGHGREMNGAATVTMVY